MFAHLSLHLAGASARSVELLLEEWCCSKTVGQSGSFFYESFIIIIYLSISNSTGRHNFGRKQKKPKKIKLKPPPSSYLINHFPDINIVNKFVILVYQPIPTRHSTKSDPSSSDLVVDSHSLKPTVLRISIGAGTGFCEQ